MDQISTKNHALKYIISLDYEDIIDLNESNKLRSYLDRYHINIWSTKIKQDFFPKEDKLPKVILEEIQRENNPKFIYEQFRSIVPTFQKLYEKYSDKLINFCEFHHQINFNQQYLYGFLWLVKNKNINLDELSQTCSIDAMPNEVKILYYPGLGRDLYQGERFNELFKEIFNENYILYGDNPVECCTNIGKVPLKFWDVNIAQERDIQHHYELYDKLTQKYPNDKLILLGNSRGSAATFNAMATYKYENVKLVILEGCYDTTNSVLRDRYGEFWGDVYEDVLDYFTSWNKDGISPLSLASEFPQDIPVLFITSKTDQRVRCERTFNLVKKLRKYGKNVHLLVLENSTHDGYLTDNFEDRKRYIEFVSKHIKLNFNN